MFYDWNNNGLNDDLFDNIMDINLIDELDGEFDEMAESDKQVKQGNGSIEKNKNQGYKGL